MMQIANQELVAAGLRSALRSLVRPVAVITAEHDGSRHAMAATAFCEVSMSPPSMLVCINRNNATYAAIAKGAQVGFNLLAQGQDDVSRVCGSSASADLKFGTGNWLIEPGKPPRLADSCAAMVMTPVNCVDFGTQAVVIGEITDVSCRGDLAPLGFHAGDYLSPLAQAALNLVARSRVLGEAASMSDGYMMMDLMRAFYWFDEGLQSALKARGWQSISRAQSILFANLALGTQRPADLARNLGVSRQAVSKMLQEMAEQDLVTIRPDPADKRAQLVSFSDTSARLRADALDILSRLENEVGQRIGPKGFKALRAALEKGWGDVPVVEPS